MIWGCNLFSTRNPESPLVNNSNFIPPTTPDLVLNNLQSSIKQKNVDNYISCFSDTNVNSKLQFIFTPSNDANEQFPNIFSSWNLSSERLYFNHLISNMDIGISPVLELSLISGYFPLGPDSVSFTCNYYLFAQHNRSLTPEKYSGKIQFTFIKNSSTGWWSIRQWIDQAIINDTIPSTWSVLKAKFVN